MASVPHPLIRRIVSVPVLILATGAGIALTPLALLVLGLIDLVTGPRRMRRVRTWLLAVTALLIECGGVIAAGWHWLRHRRHPESNEAVEAGFRLQHWWVGHHARNLRRQAGLRWVVENPELAQKGDAVVVARHASHADAILPMLLFGTWSGLEVRYTLKDALQWAPAMDLVGNRTPNVFVDRTPGTDSPLFERIESLAAGMGDSSVAVIFPEGTFHTPHGHARAVERVAANRPDLADLAGQLRYLLPPRPQGTRALLRGAPASDVVVVGHEGMEVFGSLGDIFRNLPLRQPVRVRLWRIERAFVPTGDDELMTWMLDRWVEMDAWIHERAAERAHDIESVGGQEIPT